MPGESSQQIITYWLCPAEPAHRQLAALIRDLATRFNAPIFEPHVTIYSTNSNSENPDAVLEKVLNRKRAYRLVMRGLDYSDEFTKTFFVQFEPDDALARLSEELRRASVFPGDYELNPHLSLIYKKMDDETKRRLADSVVLPFTEVLFDRAKAVLSPDEIKSHTEIEAWRVLSERRLTA